LVRADASYDQADACIGLTYKDDCDNLMSKLKDNDGKPDVDCSEDLMKLVCCVKDKYPAGTVDKADLRPIYAKESDVNAAFHEWIGQSRDACSGDDIKTAIFASPRLCMSQSSPPPKDTTYFGAKRRQNLVRRDSCTYTAVYCLPDEGVPSSIDDLKNAIEKAFSQNRNRPYKTNKLVIAPATLVEQLWQDDSYGKGRSCLKQNNQEGYGSNQACGKPSGVLEVESGSNLALFMDCGGEDSLKLYVECMS